MPEPTQPHDKLFKGLLDQPGTAGALLRERLPPDIACLLTDDPPELIDGEFIDEALQGSQSDRLFKAMLKNGGEVFLYVLIDHKSTPDQGIILQLLGYMTRIWLRWAGGRAEALRTLPPILPLVVYHGASEWKVSLSLRDTIKAPEAIKATQPDLRYVLVDLGPIPNAQLSAYPPLRAGLLALKYSHKDGDTEAVLVQAFTDARDLPSLFSMLVVYATTVYPDVNPPLLRTIIRKVKPEWEDQMLSIAAKEWMAEGRAEGETKGKAVTFRRLLQRKFKTLPSNVEALIQAANGDQLDEWLDRILDAKGFTDIFGSDLPH
ncbi:MAG: Rpn family recombination-promoting nuclease/putative transposase [Rhodospirillaceae bacterium]